MKEKKTKKTLYAEISVKQKDFNLKFFSKDIPQKSNDPILLRQLFSKEKSRILFEIKTKNPDSIYSLAKSLKRDLKSVREDLKLLKRFGFIDFYSIKKGKKTLLKPVLALDSLEIIINV